MKHYRPRRLAAALGCGGIVGRSCRRHPAGRRLTVCGRRPAWTRCNGPSLLTNSAAARPFECDARRLRNVGEAYVRAKIGFCNCPTGVADDAELERIGDLRSAWREGCGAGRRPPHCGRPDEGPQPSLCARRTGSARHIRLVDRLQRPPRRHCCNRVLRHNRPDIIEPNVIAFLNSPTIMRWAEGALGL